MDGILSTSGGWFVVLAIFLIVAVNVIDIGKKRER